MLREEKWREKSNWKFTSDLSRYATGLAGLNPVQGYNTPVFGALII
jgi:hypothetical protein